MSGLTSRPKGHQGSLSGDSIVRRRDVGCVDMASAAAMRERRSRAERRDITWRWFDGCGRVYVSVCMYMHVCVCAGGEEDHQRRVPRQQVGLGGKARAWKGLPVCHDKRNEPGRCGSSVRGCWNPAPGWESALAIAVGRVGGRRGLPTAPTLCLAREATMSMLFGVPTGKLFAQQAELKPLALACPASVSLGQASHPHLHPQPCFVCSDGLSIFHCGAYCLILCELLLV